MNWITKLNTLFAPRELSRARVVTAIAVAAVADFLQIVLLPLEWAFAQQIVDVIAMGLTMWLIGFHLLLLPTFVVEFIPVVDMLPTWTGCVVAVIALRKRGQSVDSPPVTTNVESPTPGASSPAQIGSGDPNQGTLPRQGDTGN